ncbi:hypothetical protein OUZ56_011780 [Daphnia magna]|uniref:Uncharacterized protein n=1 Tax=Daphnia magna TaxID=35525 RepID=A0ABQ9Z173_9CRUS|nr:hypothetical protein OUZ56_011780 [Daphnia magna]
MKNRIFRSNNKVKSLEERIKEFNKACKVLVSKERRNSVDCKMKFLSQTEAQVVRAFFQKGSLKPTDKYLKGMRYELAFVIDATLMFMKSHAAYVFF